MRKPLTLLSVISGLIVIINHFGSKSQAIFVFFMKQYLLGFFVRLSNLSCKNQSTSFPLWRSRTLWQGDSISSLGSHYLIVVLNHFGKAAHIFQIKWPAGEKLSSLLNFNLPASRSDQEFLLDFQLRKLTAVTRLPLLVTLKTTTITKNYHLHIFHQKSSSYLCMMSLSWQGSPGTEKIICRTSVCHVDVNIDICQFVSISASNCW